MLEILKSQVCDIIGATVKAAFSACANGYRNLPALREEALHKLNHIYPHKITAVLSYMRKNYSHDISLQNVADYVGITPNYLSHLFSHHFQTRFTEALNQIRITQACSLLSDISLTVTQVSSLVGFRSIAYFARIFKRLEGQTPSEYRVDFLDQRI